MGCYGEGDVSLYYFVLCLLFPFCHPFSRCIDAPVLVDQRTTDIFSRKNRDTLNRPDRGLEKALEDWFETRKQSGRVMPEAFFTRR